jgi:hypothetical protein
MAISKEVTNHTLGLPTKPERYQMKPFLADLMYQVLIELLSQMLMRLAEWLAVATWL